MSLHIMGWILVEGQTTIRFSYRRSIADVVNWRRYRNPPGELSIVTVTYFHPRSEMPDESGEFRLDAAPCIAYLDSQVKLFGLAADASLLMWMIAPSREDVRIIPDEFDERTRVLVADLIEESGAIGIRCRQCDRDLAASDLHRQDWDRSTTVEGIRIGSAGYKFVCDKSHNLIYICTRLY
ncbi:MAG: hypothetical protein KDA60_12660 [Planctomycetales bacterium]|nr:hypothetical protein [Planctomycetales bacterium]